MKMGFYSYMKSNDPLKPQLSHMIISIEIFEEKHFIRFGSQAYKSLLKWSQWLLIYCGVAGGALNYGGCEEAPNHDTMVDLLFCYVLVYAI